MLPPLKYLCTVQNVSGVYGFLTLPNASLRHAAAGLVVQLLPDQGRDALEEAKEQLQVSQAADADINSLGKQQWTALQLGVVPALEFVQMGGQLSAARHCVRLGMCATACCRVLWR